VFLLYEKKLTFHLLLVAFGTSESGVFAKMNAASEGQEVSQEGISYSGTKILDQPELVSRNWLFNEIRYELQVSV
jgi:hypothetical protein